MDLNTAAALCLWLLRACHPGGAVAGRPSFRLGSSRAPLLCAALRALASGTARWVVPHHFKMSSLIGVWLEGAPGMAATGHRRANTITDFIDARYLRYLLRLYIVSAPAHRRVRRSKLQLHWIQGHGLRNPIFKCEKLRSQRIRNLEDWTVAPGKAWLPRAEGMKVCLSVVELSGLPQAGERSSRSASLGKGLELSGAWSPWRRKDRSGDP